MKHVGKEFYSNIVSLTVMYNSLGTKYFFNFSIILRFISYMPLCPLWHALFVCKLCW